MGTPTGISPAMPALANSEIRLGQAIAASPVVPELDNAPVPTTQASDTILRAFVSGGGGGKGQAIIARGIVTHTVASGDTLFGIAGDFDVSPESILWSNYGNLRDDPDLLSIGQQLLIPPANGVVVLVEGGDTVESIARRLKVGEASIVAEPINQLVRSSDTLQKGRLVFVPGGQRETIVWQMPKPVEVRVNAGGVKVYSVGVCGEVAIPRLGANAYIYPVNTRNLSGYNYSASHPGLDFAGRLGDPIYAADSGTVIYAGYSLGANGAPVGYGQYVVIDHGNGYQTLYAHASRLFVRCGQQVTRGAQIAAIGSVGRSTGPHLHFELRLGGVALNPWARLPPP
ncbi:MAG TPA: peptidoglycan DD-metalloendopeptidase family protein [Thermoflexales bacterium]|nr:peptidoglycan DD-metalloendopeptidase family protein [Thermoflexales bacterium]